MWETKAAFWMPRSNDSSAVANCGSGCSTAWLTVMPISAMWLTPPAPACGPPSGRTMSVPAVRSYGSQLVDNCAGLTSARNSYVVHTHNSPGLDPESCRDVCGGPVPLRDLAARPLAPPRVAPWISAGYSLTPCLTPNVARVPGLLGE